MAKVRLPPDGLTGLYGASSRWAGQGSAHRAHCNQIAAGWRAGEPGTSENRQARRGAGASDAEAAQQLQFIAEKLSIGLLLFRGQGSPLGAKDVSARPGAARFFACYRIKVPCVCTVSFIETM